VHEPPPNTVIIDGVDVRSLDLKAGLIGSGLVTLAVAAVLP